MGKRQSKIAAKLKQQCLLQQLIQEFVCLLAAHGRGRSAQSLRRIMANQEGLKAAAGGAFVGPRGVVGLQLLGLLSLNLDLTYNFVIFSSI